MTSVCDGIRVLDFTNCLAGAMATMLLADNGAEVVKIEPPQGDPMRSLPAWTMWNRGKQSAVLDLERAAGQAAAAGLAARSDVLIESFAPGVIDRRGLGYEALATANPRLVQCSITAFGSRGRYKNLPPVDGVVEARGGGYAELGASMWLRPAAGPAYRARPNPSFTGANLAVQGIIAALSGRRERSGRGQQVETSLYQALGCYDFQNSLARQNALGFVHGGGASPLPMTGFRVNLSYLAVRCKDGQWMQLTNLSARLWSNLMRTLGLAEVVQQPYYRGLPGGWTEEARQEMAYLILERMQERPIDEWLEIFAQNDVAGERFLTTQQCMDYAQVRHIGGVIAIDDPTVGPSEQIAPVIRFADTPSQVTRPAPLLGEHTAEVLALAAPPPRAGANGHATEWPEAAPPFSGMLVLDFANWLAAPAGTSLIADLGARVIKVESPTGDELRIGVAGGGKGRTFMGKESVVIDLKTPEGQRALEALVRKANGLMTNMRGDIPTRLGLDYEAVRKLNPAIVYLYAGSYGSTGPGAGRPAFHPTAGALSGGVLWQLGNGNDVPNDEPLSREQLLEQSIRLLQANEGSPDLTSAAVVGTAMAMGLFALQRTGKGQYIETTMLMSNALICSEDFIRYPGKPDRTPVDRSLRGLHALYRLYRAGEGWLFLACTTDQQWQNLCYAIGRPELLADARFATPAERHVHDQQLIAALAGVFLSRTADQWEAELLDADVPCVRADRHLADVFLSDEFVRENDFSRSVEHPGVGRMMRWGPFWRFSATPARAEPAHLFGEDTPAVLQELGISPEEIADWRRRTIVAWKEPVPAG